MSKSVPKLLQEANEVKKVLEKIGAGLPESISAEGVEAKIVALETVVSDLDALNAERTRLVNAKADQASGLSDYLVQVRSAVKGVFGADSSEYDMVGSTRTSERKPYTKKAVTDAEKAKGR